MNIALSHVLQDSQGLVKGLTMLELVCQKALQLQVRGPCMVLSGTPSALQHTAADPAASSVLTLKGSRNGIGGKRLSLTAHGGVDKICMMVHDNLCALSCHAQPLLTAAARLCLPSHTTITIEQFHFGRPL